MADIDLDDLIGTPDAGAAVQERPADVPGETLLTMEQVTRKLAVSRPTVYKLIREHGFPEAIKLGGSSRWRLSEVDAYINAQAG